MLIARQIEDTIRTISSKPGLLRQTSARFSLSTTPRIALLGERSLRAQFRAISSSNRPSPLGVRSIRSYAPARAATSTKLKSNMDAAKEAFFESDHYAVVGASKDPSKIGNKVMKWYVSHGFQAIPVHPKEAAIEEVPTIASVFDIHEPASTSISIITPPHVTMPVLRTALLELNVAAVWLQVRKWILFHEPYRSCLTLGIPPLLFSRVQKMTT